MKSSLMVQHLSGMPDLTGPALAVPLSDLESQLLRIAHARWPTSSLEIAEFLGHSVRTREEKRLLSSRITYHIKKLVQKKKLISKRVGNALIVWPYEVEALRVMHELMRPAVEEKSPRKNTPFLPVEL